MTKTKSPQAGERTQLIEDHVSGHFYDCKALSDHREPCRCNERRAELVEYFMRAVVASIADKDASPIFEGDILEAVARRIGPDPEWDDEVNDFLKGNPWQQCQGCYVGCAGRSPTLQDRAGIMLCPNCATLANEVQKCHCCGREGTRVAYHGAGMRCTVCQTIS